MDLTKIMAHLHRIMRLEFSEEMMAPTREGGGGIFI